jgi:hypothetical protein
VTDSSRKALLQNLAQRIHEVEAAERARARLAISLGIPALDDCFPNGGLAAGSLVEIFSAAAGGGAWTLAFVAAQRACGEHKALVVTDARGCFYPPAAVKLGVALERCVVVRPTTSRDAAAALRQALGCSAVGAAVGWFDALGPSECRRLQLAAEKGGGVGLLLRPLAARQAPSFAALRLLVKPWEQRGRSSFSAAANELRPLFSTRRIRVEVVRVHGAKSGQSLILEIDDETGHVRVPAGLAAATAGARKPCASG